jgi:hypothetical protein
VPLASLTSSVTSFVGDHGLYAVFLLMLVDAVLPAASELVMVSAGALAAGAFSTDQIAVPGGHVSEPFWIFFTLALAGTMGEDCTCPRRSSTAPTHGSGGTEGGRFSWGG